jgi:multisubunit Na+/H+ antiporter MnhC subunit
LRWFLVCAILIKIGVVFIMKNKTFTKIFLGLGGAAAGANVASIAAGALLSGVPLFVPVVGAVVAGALAYSAAQDNTPNDSQPTTKFLG